MEGRTRVVVAPTVEPVTLELARLQCEVFAEGSPPTSLEDPKLEQTISAARDAAEQFMGRSVAEKTLEVRFDAWPDELELPFSPVIEVMSVAYIDGDGAVQTLAPSAYELDTHSLPARIAPAYGTTWPTSRAVTGAIRIRYRAGYEPYASPATEEVPASIVAAILLTIGHNYKNRESVADRPQFELPMGATALMRPYQIRKGLA